MKVTRLIYIFVFYINIYFMTVAFSATEDPRALQDKGIKNILEYIHTINKTGESNNEILNQALGKLNKSVMLFNEENNTDESALSKIKIGNIYRILRNFDVSYKYYKEAYQLLLDSNKKEYKARSLLGMAKVEMYHLRNYGDALININKAISLIDKEKNIKLYTESLDYKSQSQIYNNDFIAASTTLDKAIEIADRINDTTILFYIYFGYADLHQQIGTTCDFERYFDYCKKELSLARKYYLNSRDIALSLKWDMKVKDMDGFINRLDMREKLVDFQKRKEKLYENSSKFHPKKESDVVINKKFILGSLNLDSEVIKKIKEIKEKDSTISPRVSYINGLYYEANGNIDEAIEKYENAAELLDRDRTNLSTTTQKSDFLNDKMEIYYTLILHLLDKNYNEKAFNVMERSFSRGLRDILHTSKIEMSNSKDKTFLGLFEKNREKISELQFKIYKNKEKLKDVDELRRQIEVYEEKNKTLLTSISSSKSSLYEVVSPDIPTLTTVQNKLKEENYEIVEYLVQDSQLIIWHIKKDKVTIKSIYLPKNELSNKVNAISDLDEHTPFDKITSKELFLFLIQPIIKNIESKHLVIIPHYKLHKLPFQALINPDNGKYLGEDFQISYAPSSTILMNLKRINSLEGKSLLAIGDKTISSVNREVNGISKLFPRKNRIIFEPFSKLDLNSTVGEYDILHLSVHGVFNSSKPMLSYLKLNPKDSLNGNLTAAEMFGLPLKKGSLVVLSACETKISSSQSNETLGMIRSLLYSGAETLLLSSWKVDADSTALWMNTFYEVAIDKPLAEAARQALIRVKSNPKFEHPYYWAAFSMIGK